MAIDKAKSSSLSTAARVNSMMTTMSHRIPHRFVSATSITPQNCIVCKKRVWSLKASVGKCSCKYKTESDLIYIACGLFVHEKCSNLALPTCGLSMGMLSNALLHSHIMPKSTTGISNNHLEGATSHSFKSKPYPNPVPCIICDKPIWGIQLGGVNCSDCGLDLHEGCSENGNLPICCDKELLNQKENISHQDISPTSSTLPRRGSVKNRKLESLTRITRRVVYTRPIVLTAGQNENTPSFEVNIA